MLALYLSLYWGVFGLVASWYWRVSDRAGIFIIPSVWVLLEYIRSHALTGFPWALLAYTQTNKTAIIQISELTGAWGVSFLIIMVNTAAFEALRHWPDTGKCRKSALLITIAFFWVFQSMGQGVCVHSVTAMRQTRVSQ